MDLIRVENVYKTYGDVSVLKDLSFALERGEHYVIKGSSGSGKSTLMYLLGGLERPTEGKVFLEKFDLSKLNEDRLASFRNKDVGFVFQFHFLLPSMTCLDNILLPGKIGGKNISKIKDFVQELAVDLGVDHCLSKFPYEISGGEQQRINIIRALSLRPRLLLCDEPTGNLDSSNTLKVVELLKRLARENNSTLVVVTHDDSVADCFENIVYLRDGQIVR